MRLFVYGTLKRGQCRSHYLHGQEFVGFARTQPKYRIFNIGEYPGMVESPDGRCIEGEVWDIDEAGIQLLDRVESVDDGQYARQSVSLQPPFAEDEIYTYFYLCDIRGLPDCGTCW